MNRKQRALISTLLLAAAGCSCGSRNTSHDGSMDHSMAIKVVTRSVSMQESVQSRSFSGVVEPSCELPLSFLASGRVTQVTVKEGDRVHKGQILARLDDSSEQISLEGAQATLSQATDGMERILRVYDKGSISEVQKIEMETKLAQAQAMYDLALKAVENCVLTAPVDGVMGKVAIVEGTNAFPGQTAMQLLQTDILYASISVPEGEIGMFAQGMKLEVAVEAAGLSKIEATVEKISMKPTLLGHSYTVTSAFKSDARAGMLCNVTVPQKGRESVILPPDAVLIAADGGKYVYTVTDGHAYRTRVCVGSYIQGGISVTEGLEEGTEVVVEGYQKLYEGCPVEIKK